MAGPNRSKYDCPKCGYRSDACEALEAELAELRAYLKCERERSDIFQAKYEALREAVGVAVERARLISNELMKIHESYLAGKATYLATDLEAAVSKTTD